MSSSRRLAAIMFTDIVGYTAMMQQDEVQAVAAVSRYLTALQETVPAHSGKIMNDYGDGSLCIFPSAIEAVQCCLEIQERLADPLVPLRIGLHLGEIFFQDEKAFGDGVNIASRIQSLASAKSILLSKEFFDQIRNHPQFKTVSLGYFHFKNVDEAIEVFALANEGLVVPEPEQMTGKIEESGKPKRALRNIIAVASVVMLLAAFPIARNFQRANNEIENSIAVMPFINMSADPQQEYFAQGMMDEILNQLYKVGGLVVVSRTSSLTYKNTSKTSKQIAEELGVGNLLEGSVQKEGDRIRVIIQLINTRTDNHLWSESYDREFKDIFAIQSDIAQQVASALKIKIDVATKSRIEKAPTANASVYDAYLQTKDESMSSEKWRGLLEELIRVDSSFAPAYADLASYWLGRGGYRGDMDARQVLEQALPLLDKAVHYDSSLSSTRACLATALLWYEWNFKGAGNEWKKYFQLNPAGVYFSTVYADFLTASGRFKEAFNFCLKNRDDDKKNIGNWTALSRSYFYSGQADKAEVILDSALLIFKDASLFSDKAGLLVTIGRYQQAGDYLDKYFKAFPDNNDILRFQAWSAISDFYTGRGSETEKILDSLKIRSARSAVGSPAFYMAMIFSATGRKEQAIQWLQKAYNDHEVELYWLKVEPLFKTLHGDPRFQSLLKKICFPD